MNNKVSKYKAAIKAKKYGYDYWDGNRDINYGGYNYIEGRWDKIIKKLLKKYKLPKTQKFLIWDVEKVFLYDF